MKLRLAVVILVLASCTESKKQPSLFPDGFSEIHLGDSLPELQKKLQKIDAKAVLTRTNADGDESILMEPGLSFTFARFNTKADKLYWALFFIENYPVEVSERDYQRFRGNSNGLSAFINGQLDPVFRKAQEKFPGVTPVVESGMNRKSTWHLCDQLATYELLFNGSSLTVDITKMEAQGEIWRKSCAKGAAL